jgi:endonuclease I
LRASTVSVNSSRGNLAFVQGSGSYGRVGSGWYPGDTHKGDVARIILYMHVRHGLSISSGVIGDLNMFLRWHIEDPVDDFELNRNNVIYSYVNNRNPFIDHPEFAQLIWGTPSARNEVVRDIEPLPFVLVNEIVILQPVHYYEPKNQFMNFIQ